MTKTLKSPDNQMNWTDYSKSAVALFGLVYLCLVYLCLAIGFGIAGSPYSLNRCIPQRRVGSHRRRIFSGLLPQPGNQVAVFVGN